MKAKVTIEEYKIPYADAFFGKEERDAVMEVLSGRWLGPYKKAWEFEKKVSRLFGKRYGLFVNSGSSANLLAVMVQNFPKGKEVITPACTFNTTISPIVHAQLIPVLVDSKPGNYNATIEEIEKAISPKTVAIMLPDTCGMLNDWPRIRELFGKRALLIQDSCDTQGAKICGRPSGTWADIVTTSSYFTHTITTAGMGGMVMMDAADVRKKIEILATWGRRSVGYNESIKERFDVSLGDTPYDGKFVYETMGFHLRATEIQAAFGLVQLKYLKKFNQKRRAVTKKIVDFLKDYEEYFVLPEFIPQSQHSLLAFPVTIQKHSPLNRRSLLEYLEEHKIQTRLLFAGNIVHHPGFKNVHHRRVGRLDGATAIMERSFLLPNHHSLTQAQLDYLFDVIAAYMKKQ